MSELTLLTARGVCVINLAPLKTALVQWEGWSHLLAAARKQGGTGCIEVDKGILLFLHLSLNHVGPWGTTDDFTTSILHISLFSTALLDLATSRPVHSLMLSSHLFLCPCCILPPYAVPHKMVVTRPDEHETCPYVFSLRVFTMVRRSLCGAIACWILAWTSLLVTWSL